VSNVEEGYQIYFESTMCDTETCWIYDQYSVYLPPGTTSYRFGVSEPYVMIAAMKDGGTSDWVYGARAVAAQAASLRKFSPTGTNVKAARLRRRLRGE
jgi:hypothetical protein